MVSGAMSRSSHDTSHSVSLFPFLAVLVCAMGALIFLLLITALRIRNEDARRAALAFEESQTTVAAASEIVVPAKPVAPPIDPNDELRAAISQREAQRSTRLAALNQQAARLRRLREEAAESQRIESQALSQAERVRGTTAEQLAAIKEISAERHQIAAQLHDVQEQLVIAQEQAAQASSKFVVVPFDGQNGTTRRPILIECTADGLQFIPEGIVLGAGDVEGFPLSVNPLLSGARALVEYWATVDQSTGTENQPYVLLLVRPEGAASFYAAQKLLSNLEQQFGYELIEAHVDLALPTADPQAIAACRSAVDELLRRREQVVAAVTNAREVGDPLPSHVPGGGRAMRFDPRRGTFDVVKDDGDRTSPSGGPPGSRRNGGGGVWSNGSNGSGNGNGAPGGSGQKRGTSAIPNGESEPGSAVVGLTPSAGEPRQLRGGSGPREVAPNPFERGTGGAGGAGGGNAGTGRELADAGGNAASHGTGSKTGEPRRLGSTAPNAGDSGELEQRIGAQQNGVAGSSEAPSTGATAPGGYGNAPAGTPNAIGGPAGTPGGTASAPSGTAGATSGAGGAPGGTAGAAGGSASAADGSAGAPSGAVGTPGGTAGGPQGASDGGQPGAGVAAAPNWINSNKQKSNRPPLRKFGMSLPGASIGFEREIPVEVHGDRLIVAGKEAVAIADDTPTEELFERLVVALDRQVRTWGWPPQNFYWVPTVRFVVRPGGIDRYEGLLRPLQRIGITSNLEFRLNEVPPQTAKGAP